MQDYSWTFTTEAAPDTTAPRVQTVSSANLTRGVTRGINASNSAETTMPPRTNNVLLANPNLKASEPTSPSVLPNEGVQVAADGLRDELVLSAEDYLVERGYLVPDDLGLPRGTYTITREGYRWLERGPVTA